MLYEGVRAMRTRTTAARLVLAVLATGLLVLVWAGAAQAQSVHLKGGRNAEPAFVDNGLTLTASGELAGLGNEDVLVTITATANPIATCQNPGSGEHFPPGQNPAPVQVTGSVSIPAEEIKNGNTPFTVTTEAPVSPVPGAPDCPNSQWIEEIVDMQFTAATITVEQPAGTLVLTVTCSISPPSSDGAIPRTDVTCTSS
jgi:hypothetical protein